MHPHFANIARRSVAIRLKPFRRCALAALAVAALCWPDIGQAQTLAVHVQGNQLVNQNGAIVHLRGVDYDGTELACVGGGGGNGNGYAVFQGPSDANAITALQSWHVNAVRLPLNEDCWLGINLPGSDSNYYGSAYQGAVETFVQALNNVGIYVILDLHWNAPGTNVANAQQPMIDQEHGPAFWSSVAGAFKNYPAVIFDLYNEPHDISWDCWLNGCTVSNSYGSWPTDGMADLVSRVRNAGATQPIMLGGLSYASDLSQWSANKPTDTLNPPQLVASYHSYCGPPGTSTVAACQGYISGIESSQWPVVQTVANSTPVVTGEFGEYDCATTYVPSYMAFADTYGISYVGWSWNNFDCASDPALITNTTGTNQDYYNATPTPYGMGLHDRLAALYRFHDTHDFSNDGMSDIFWRNTSGTPAVWLMNGGTVSQSAGFGAVPSSFSVIGQHDFDGDGKADVLWRDSSGNVSMWFMNGTAVASAAAVGNLTSNWTLDGTGDLNGDGKGDLLWRDSTTGTVAVWFMNGAAVTSTAVFGALPSTWTIVGDANGSILWRDSAGDIALWGVQKGQVTSSSGLGNVTSNFVVQGIGDFNGDGYPDILWRDTNTGVLSIWFTNGAQVTSAGVVGTLPSIWSVAQVGDYNGDGSSDILLLDSSGDLAMWLMSGATVSSSVGVSNVGPTWQVQNVNAN